MKKLGLSLLALASALWMNAATAAPTVGYSSAVYQGLTAKINAVIHPNTDITVINASSAEIYMVVPGAVDRRIERGYNGHIYADVFYNTALVLLDPYRHNFQNINACRLSIITVYGYPGNYALNIDDDLCR
jgi:hypothetical protein